MYFNFNKTKYFCVGCVPKNQFLRRIVNVALAQFEEFQKFIYTKEELLHLQKIYNTSKEQPFQDILSNSSPARLYIWLECTKNLDMIDQFLQIVIFTSITVSFQYLPHKISRFLKFKALIKYIQLQLNFCKYQFHTLSFWYLSHNLNACNFNITETPLLQSIAGYKLAMFA